MQVPNPLPKTSAFQLRKEFKRDDGNVAAKPRRGSLPLIAKEVRPNSGMAFNVTWSVFDQAETEKLIGCEQRESCNAALEEMLASKFPEMSRAELVEFCFLNLAFAKGSGFTAVKYVGYRLYLTRPPDTSVCSLTHPPTHPTTHCNLLASPPFPLSGPRPFSPS